MPGGRRSRGCLLCVQRRLKCDERLPGCARCETYGRPCPGYDRGFKFVEGKPYRTPRRPKSSTGGRCGGNSTSERTSQAVVQLLTQKCSPLSLKSTGLNMSQSLDILINDLSWPFPSAAYTPSRYFCFLPTIYGRNSTLDASVRCFVAHHIGNTTDNMQALKYSRSAYVEALNTLHRSLSNSVESVSAEVLCSVLLLCMYELFANTDDSVSWMKHAKGLGQLVKFRGCHRYRNEFDYSLLKASRGVIVMHSVFSGEECFLASDNWLLVMRQRLDDHLPPALYDRVEDLFVLFTRIPKLIHRMFGIKDADMSSPTMQLHLSELIAETLVMQNELDAWYGRFTRVVPLSTETPSGTGDTLFPIVFHFVNVDVGSLFCTYYSYMTVLHWILKNCGYGPNGNHEARVVYFRDQVCKSVEYNAQGLLGPSRLGFPLRVVHEVADSRTKSWVDSWLQRLSRHYAALTPRNFA